MLFTKTTIDNVLKVLSKNKNISLKELHTLVNQEEKISLPNLYKITNNLLDNQILSKNKRKLSLNTSRIIELDLFLKETKNNYLEKRENFIHIKEGWIQKYEVNSFVEAETLWSEIYTQLSIIQGKDNGIYSYNSHFYYLLAFPETEKTIRKSVHQLSEKTKFILWNDSFLDQYSIEILRLKWFQTIINKKTKFPKKGYVIDVIWDYYIEFFIPDTISTYLETFFNNVKKMEDFNLEIFKSIFLIKDTYILRVIHNKTAAKSLRDRLKIMH